ncbi:hypothetical protein Taro_046890 [Colocasia esculenta]|uniref:Uncharacterized protein n=1 Tax=Colocasia esculenta TaxID=4460 RepID=A0A843X7N5_COLES|nr:hypothetical protein [Colocasia esculenta]
MGSLHGQSDGTGEIYIYNNYPAPRADKTIHVNATNSSKNRVTSSLAGVTGPQRESPNRHGCRTLFYAFIDWTLQPARLFKSEESAPCQVSNTEEGAHAVWSLATVIPPTCLPFGQVWHLNEAGQAGDIFS